MTTLLEREQDWELGRELERKDAEIDRLRALISDACKVFEHYDLPEHAFHYRRAISGLEQAKKIARATPSPPEHPEGT